MTFTAERDPADLPTFNHTELRASLGRVFAEATQMLAVAVRESYLLIPLAARTDNTRLGELKDERLQRCAGFVLIVETEADHPTVMRDLPRLVKIASWDKINAIVRSNTPGVPIQPL